MRHSDRLALIVIAISMLILSPLNIGNMAFDGVMWRTYTALLCGLSWLYMFISGGIVLFVCLSESDSHTNKP